MQHNQSVSNNEEQSCVILRGVLLTDHCRSLETNELDHRFLGSLHCLSDFDPAFHADEKQVHCLVNKLSTDEERSRKPSLITKGTYGLHVVIELKFRQGLPMGTNLAVGIDNGQMICTKTNPTR